MPVIRQYQQATRPSGVIEGRRSVPSDDIVLSDEAVGNVQHSADILQDVAERQEVSDVQSKLARARAEWTVHLQDRAQGANPGDPTFASKFNEDFGKYLSEIEGQAQTRAGQNAFRKGAAELSSHFVEKAGVFQSQRMGAKAVQDYAVALNSHRNTLLNDPTQHAEIERLALADLNDPTGIYANMPGDARAKLVISTRGELAMSAVQGLIQNGAPELARKQLLDGKWDAVLDADKKNKLIDEADVGIRAKDTAAERARLLAEVERKAKQEAVVGGYLARIVDPRAEGGALSDREILSNPNLDSTHKQHLIDYKLRRARELNASSQEKANPAEVRRLLLNIHAATDDPKKTYNADEVMASYKAGKITTPEMLGLRKEVEQLRDGTTSSFQKQVQSARSLIRDTFMTSIIGRIKPELAASAAYNFQADLDKAIADKRAKNEDPRVLLDPKSKEFMLDPARTAQYLRPAREAMAAEAGNARAGQPTYPEAINPQTGERLIYKDGKWQKP